LRLLTDKLLLAMGILDRPHGIGFDTHNVQTESYYHGNLLHRPTPPKKGIYRIGWSTISSANEWDIDRFARAA
jgi:hypothetical protein